MEEREETCRSIIDVLSSRIQEDNRRAESNYLPAVAIFTQTHMWSHACACASENIPNKKREAGSELCSGGFRGRLINWQTVNYWAGKSLQNTLYSTASPPFFSYFSPHLALRGLSVSSISLRPLSTVDFSSRTIRSSFFSCRFTHIRAWFFHTQSSFIHLKFCISSASSPFYSSLYTFPSIFLPLHRLADLSLTLRTAAPPFFPPVSPLFPTRRVFFPPNVTDALAFRTRSAGEGMAARIITCTHPGWRSRVRRCVKPGNRFGTRNRGERRCWQTARHGSTSHLHIAVVAPSNRARW